MASEYRDWTVPAPLRALLWWPPVAFLVALVDPSAAAGTIAATGAVLAVLGVVGSAVGRRFARRLGTQEEPVVTALAEPLPAAEQRAA
jgi:membrane protein implicated in regulation of membrane protease activity